MAVLWVFLFYHLSRAKGEGGCRDLKYLKCIENKTLTGHVISTVKMMTPALQLCQSQCFREHKCVSYNLGPVIGRTRSCELNDADHSTRPRFLVNKTGYEYCPIQNPCLSKPCPVERLCVPDFAWNTYNCDDGGWTQWGVWTPQCPPNSICTRNRSCTNPAPTENGTSCAGEHTETRECPPKEDLTGCESPLGMEDGRITDGDIKASSYFKERNAPWFGRLNRIKSSSDEGVWSSRARKEGEYIQVDLKTMTFITKVATQGRPESQQWVTKYSLAYSNDAKNWKNYEEDCVIKVFHGNNDSNIVVINKLERPIKTMHIRLIATDFYGHPSLRMEVYGC